MGAFKPEMLGDCRPIKNVRPSGASHPIDIGALCDSNGVHIEKSIIHMVAPSGRKMRPESLTSQPQR